MDDWGRRRSGPATAFFLNPEPSNHYFCEHGKYDQAGIGRLRPAGPSRGRGPDEARPHRGRRLRSRSGFPEARTRSRCCTCCWTGRRPAACISVSPILTISCATVPTGMRNSSGSWRQPWACRFMGSGPTSGPGRRATGCPSKRRPGRSVTHFSRRYVRPTVTRRSRLAIMRTTMPRHCCCICCAAAGGWDSPASRPSAAGSPSGP